MYFVLGYVMYAAFFATIGAMVEQESDAQYLMLPGMLPLLFSYVLASMSIEAPESTPRSGQFIFAFFFSHFHDGSIANGRSVVACGC